MISAMIHGFIVYETQNLITFDMIVDFDADREKVKSRILKEIKQKHPQYTYQVIDDYDVSDLKYILVWTNNISR